MYRVFDIFSGAGGMAEGFLRAGFKIPFATDISTQAMNTYVNRHRQLGHSVNFLCGDLNEVIANGAVIEMLKNENFDVVIGGPPCQGFSNAGKRSKSDKRNMLVHSYLKIIQLIEPKYFVMENVLGILSFIYDEFKGLSGEVYFNQSVVDILLTEFDRIGYRVQVKVLDAYDFGVPQKRRRVFFLGSRNDCQPVPDPICSDERYTVRDAIADLCNDKHESKFQADSVRGRTPHINGMTIKCTISKNIEQSSHKDLTIQRFKLVQRGESLRKALDRLSQEERELYRTKKNNCMRLHPDKPSPTLVTLPDDYIHYKEHRILSVRELARLQSFDDSFEFLGKRTTGGTSRKKETPQYTLVGNAVPPLLSYAIAKSVMEALQNGS